MKTFFTIITCAWLLLSATPHDLQAKSKHDPIVGVWLQNQRPAGDSELILAAQAIFNADGTVSRNLDPDLQRVLGPPEFPEGTVFSISDDYSEWERVSKHCYKCVGTQIVLIKNLDGTFTPLARAKCEINLSVHGKNMTGRETLSFYDYYDLTLTVPFLGLPTLEFVIEGRKLQT